MYTLVKNAIGFYEASPKPTVDELKKHYAEKYYQESSGSYRHAYSKNELKYFDSIAEISCRTFSRFSKLPLGNLLDLGCGEGFFSKHYYEKGWDVTLIDFSENGVSRQNPKLLPYFKQGDISTFLEVLDESKTFDLINLDNVLEHVIDPVDLLIKIKKVMNKDTILRVEVPNDFSSFQALLVDMECTDETWVSPPEHLSYFNKDSLKSLFNQLDFKLLSLQADYPIEQHLINENSNYWKNKSLGRSAHLTRVLVTNYMVETNLDRMIDYQEAAADLEFGRLLTAYVSI